MDTSAKAKKPFTRFGEFEFMKALAIMGLPFVHVMEEMMEDGFNSPALNQFGYGIIGLCVVGPSVFMICMGFSMGGAKTPPDKIRNTGIQFLIIGAILNILRWLLPGAIVALAHKWNFMDSVEYCLQSDIYYFVGIFYILYSFLKSKKITTEGMLIFSLASLSINALLTPLTGTYVTNSVAASILGNFVYVNDSSCFPLLSWAIFPTIGVLMGEKLKKTTDEERAGIMKRLLIFGIILQTSMSIFLAQYGIDVIKVMVSPLNEYITDFPNVVMLVSAALIIISLAYYLCQRIGSSPFMAFMLKVSAYIIPFYLIQWVMAAWLDTAYCLLDRPEGSFGFASYFISVACIMAVCTFVSTRYGMKIMKILVKYTTIKKKRKKTAPKKAAAQ